MEVLSGDMDVLSENMNLLSGNMIMLSVNMNLLSENMTVLSGNMNLLSENMTVLSGNMNLLSRNMTVLSGIMVSYLFPTEWEYNVQSGLRPRYLPKPLASRASCTCRNVKPCAVGETQSAKKTSLSPDQIPGDLSCSLSQQDSVTGQIYCRSQSCFPAR